MSDNNLKELTFRGMFLGALITVIFTASNVYLGLKVGMTFASSIPAAVISMAVLKFFKDSSILENNMVQNPSFISGNIVFCYFRSSRPVNDGLLARIPILANSANLCRWRYIRRAIYHSITSCDGRKQRLTLP